MVFIDLLGCVTVPLQSYNPVNRMAFKTNYDNLIMDYSYCYVGYLVFGDLCSETILFPLLLLLGIVR